MLRYPQVLCIVSQHPWFPFFYKASAEGWRVWVGGRSRRRVGPGDGAPTPKGAPPLPCLARHPRNPGNPPPDFLQALELVEKMLRQEDLGAASGEAWPPASPALLFLESLLAQVPAQPQLGAVVRVPLPATELPLDFSPPRRALTRGTAQSPLLHADSGLVELEVSSGRLSGFCGACAGLVGCPEPLVSTVLQPVHTRHRGSRFSIASAVGRTSREHRGCKQVDVRQAPSEHSTVGAARPGAGPRERRHLRRAPALPPASACGPHTCGGAAA